MRYLRMLSNSIAAAVLASTYVVTLVLQLNPTLPLHPARLVPIATTVGLFYALHLTVLFYVVLVLRQLFARELFSPAWISIGVLTWLGAAAAAAGAALMWANLGTFQLVLEPDTVRRVGNGAVILSMRRPPFCHVAARHWGRRPAVARWYWWRRRRSVVARWRRGRGATPLLTRIRR